MRRRLPSCAVNAQGAPHTPEWYLDRYDRLTARFAAATGAADLDAAVPACGDWTVADLVRHLGGVHQWARWCVEHGRSPTREEARSAPAFDRTDAQAWYATTAAELGTAMRAADHDGPTWHPFPVEHVGRVWPRRQAHEVAMHLWDLESATGRPGTIDAELASDGIDEYFEVVVPRLIVREGIAIPDSSFHVHCTDVDGEWLVWNEDGEYRMKRAHEKGDAALRGPAEVILLELWGRDHGRGDELGPVGDETALAAWTSLAGM
jgi:uncharacterized protein (TIGR03083 family)